MAMTVGGIAGIVCLAGLLLLLHRRLFDPRIRVNSSFADIAVLFLLLAQLLLGLWTITVSMQHLDGHEMVKFMNWAQHIVTFRAGAADFIRDVHPVFKLHLTLGMFIFIVFPFTRLVHIWSAPVFYVFRRQYQIVRRRET
jgi:nitrate reductase gamma subunit